MQGSIKQQNTRTIHPLHKKPNKDIYISIPGSKSHTIRALFLATLCEGTTIITNPLYSGDTQSCINIITNWGVDVQTSENKITITSPGLANIKPLQNKVDVGNSGTSLFFAIALAALMEHTIIFDGDESLRTRSATPLITALQELGATIHASKNGCPPVSVQGPITSGSVHIDCPTSQYASALLYALSCVDGESAIYPTLAGEHPYIDMTLAWLQKYGATIKNNNYTHLSISKGIDLQNKKDNATVSIPGDYSSAAFFFVASAITSIPLHIEGLIANDTQADAQVLNVLQQMGCSHTWTKNNNVEILITQAPHNKKLKGGKFDLSQIPDSLPILCIAACFASEDVQFYNVAHARQKETDRIAVMAQELSKLNVKVSEKKDGLIIHPQNSSIQGGSIDSHGDHRIAMAFSIAALAAQKPITITNSEVAAITFPNFYEILESITKT